MFHEAYRVLRPGGRLAVTDIVTRVELPPEVRHNLDSWAGCVAGAWVDKDYVAAIEEAGFEEVQIEARELDEAVIVEGAEQLGVDVAQVRASAEALGNEFIGRAGSSPPPTSPGIPVQYAAQLRRLSAPGSGALPGGAGGGRQRRIGQSPG